MKRCTTSQCLFFIVLVAAWLPASVHGVLAGEADESYYHSGPLRGSLKSDRPLPLYDDAPEHLWNRLFSALYIRPSELPSRPEYPTDTTRLDEWNRNMRSGKLAPGPIIKRIEGGDTITFPAWPKTRYYSEQTTSESLNKLLDEFILTNGERLICDPLKRAFFQHDLWAVFDHLTNQNIARFGDVEIARLRASVPAYLVTPQERQVEQNGVMQRRETLCRKLAIIIKRLAIPKPSLDALPDNYKTAVDSDYFTAQHDFDPSRNYLPTGLLTQPEKWVEIDQLRGDGKGRLGFHTWSIKGRSYYRVFWRFPGGRHEVEEYMNDLFLHGVDWEKSARDGFIALKPGLRQIPVGTESVIIQFMIVLDEELKPVPTQVVQSIDGFVYKSVDGTRDTQTNTGLGVNAYEYVIRRRLLFDGLKHGGLERNPDDLSKYRTLMDGGFSGSKDWGRYGRQQSVVQTCVDCHMHFTRNQGVYSLNAITCHVPNDMPGITISKGLDKFPTNSRGQRTVNWKLGQEDYLRLVEYARNKPPKQ